MRLQERLSFDTGKEKATVVLGALGCCCQLAFILMLALGYAQNLSRMIPFTAGILLLTSSCLVRLTDREYDPLPTLGTIALITGVAAFIYMPLLLTA